MSFSFWLTVLGVVLALVSLVLHYRPAPSDKPFPLLIAAVLCIGTALIIGGVGVLYVHWGTVH